MCTPMKEGEPEKEREAVPKNATEDKNFVEM